MEPITIIIGVVSLLIGSIASFIILKNSNQVKSNNILEQAKKEAALIYNCLYYCKKNKEKGISELKSYIQNQFEQHRNFKLEYAEIVVLNTMRPAEEWQGENKNAICIAAYHSGVRLIDNIIL